MLSQPAGWLTVLSYSQCCASSDDCTEEEECIVCTTATTRSRMMQSGARLHSQKCAESSGPGISPWHVQEQGGNAHHDEPQHLLACTQSIHVSYCIHGQSDRQ